MGTTRIHRFDFNSLRDFRGPIVAKVIQQTEAEVALPPPPVFTEQDLEAARMAAKKLGYNEGFAAGKQEATRESNAKTEEANAIISSLGETIATLTSRYEATLAAESKFLSSLVVSIARKVAGEALNQRSIEIISAMVERCLPVIFSKPRLNIELSAEVFEHTLERIETTLKAGGFEGEVQFKSNPEMQPSDVHLDWGSGQVQRSTENLWQEIEALIERVPLELTFAETLQTTTPTTGDHDGR